MAGPGRGSHPWRVYLGISLFWLALLAAAVLLMRRPAAQVIPVVLPPTAPPSPAATRSPLRVDVAGAVQAPGVYRLPAGSIVMDAIAAAGGAAADADLDRVNKAAALQDGLQVYVPRQSDPIQAAPSTRGAAPAGPAPSTPVNINTASAEELDTLPGIGPALAQRIIAERPYTNPEELLRVVGIGQAVLAGLQGLVTAQ